MQSFGAMRACPAGMDARERELHRRTRNQCRGCPTLQWMPLSNGEMSCVFRVPYAVQRSLRPRRAMPLHPLPPTTASRALGPCQPTPPRPPAPPLLAMAPPWVCLCSRPSPISTLHLAVRSSAQSRGSHAHRLCQHHIQLTGFLSVWKLLQSSVDPVLTSSCWENQHRIRCRAVCVANTMCRFSPV